MIINPSLVFASDFDSLLSELIAEKGISSGKDGIIYTTTIENNTMLAIISIEDGSFIIDVFGTENEPADSMSISFGNESFCQLSIADSDDDFCILIKDSNQTNYYRLINDAFSLSDTEPQNSTVIAKYKNRKLRLYKEPTDIYSVINNVKLERINHIPYEEVSVSSDDESQLQKLLSSCADIYEYNSESTDIDTLMRKVLYTHKNFENVTDVRLESSEKNQSLKLCNEKYITSVLFNVFRKEAPHPAVNMLTELGYCYNNKLYYYTGGYSNYFETEFHDILKIYRTDKNSLYIVFSDTYTENGTSLFEYSSATVKKDTHGYYITSLKMGDDFKEIPTSHIQSSNTDEDSSFTLGSALPFIVMLFTLAAIGVAIYIYFIR